MVFFPSIEGPIVIRVYREEITSLGGNIASVTGLKLGCTAEKLVEEIFSELSLM